ncbi:MAG: helix-turn-helix domain-containing protein, partial [Peptostreptococcaceae bacterium]
MREQEFGKMVEKLIHFSGQKNYSLAIELGYDVSYISKWINSTMLPTAKNIKKINSTIANFVIRYLDEHSLDDIIDYFEI